jgi:hypothetical protein
VSCVDHWRARCPETGTPGSEGDRTEKDPLKGRHLAVRSTLPSSIAAGVTLAAERADLAVTLASTQHDPLREPQFVEVLTRQRARAIVIAGGRRDDDEADALMRRALANFRRAGGSGP